VCRKDIFIDASIANTFPKPSESIKELITWLIDEEGTENSFIVFSTELYKEYAGGNIGCQNQNSILYIINKMMADKRYIKIGKNEIDGFINKYCSKFDFTCNKKDRNHFALIFLSDRKMALIKDKKFSNDVKRFPKNGSKNFVAIVECDPQNLNYKS